MTVAPTRWVSCGKNTHPSVAKYRHLTTQMSNTKEVGTFCGTSGSPGTLLTNNTKERCPECIEKADRNTLLRAPRRSSRERKSS